MAINIDLTLLETKLVKILREHHKHTSFWYNMSNEGEKSFQTLLQLPNDVYIIMLQESNIISRNDKRLAVKKSSLDDWLHKNDL